jgi:hypothetical protein
VTAATAVHVASSEQQQTAATDSIINNSQQHQLRGRFSKSLIRVDLCNDLHEMHANDE